ncbi:MAG: hypothetical protein QOJ65_2115 [Fimbriimonadaceae bacterium]|jgi:hypothetical protein|nr:hypothetical protein [Fimbriimonadaceae bacterium]
MALPIQRAENIESISSFLNALPSAGEAATGEDLDLRARAVVAILAERMLTSVDKTSIPQDPATCPNCGIPTASKSSPYCCDCCREQAAFVRQVRDGLSKGTIFEESRQINKGEVLWRLLGGGLPRRLALVPERARAAVSKRDNDTCQECGAPATTIDNTGSG